MKKTLSIILACCVVMFAVFSMAADRAIVIPLASSSAKKAPIAYGSISSNATINSGSGNFTCIWNSIRYEIAIDGELYSSNNYTTLVTPLGGVFIPGTGYGSNKLFVYLFNTTGNPVQGGFSFATYK